MGIEGQSRRVGYRVLAVILSGISAFFVFYEARLLVVTRGLRALHSGGQGAYIGAVVFPLLALAFGFGAWRLYKIGRRP